MRFTFVIYEPSQITQELANTFAELLKEQNKITGDFSKKAFRCSNICFVYEGGTVVAMAALKPPTQSVFRSNKANTPDLWSIAIELGYIYVRSNYRGNKLSYLMSERLLEELNPETSVMATTEFVKNPAMVRTLEKLGFEQVGNSWKSRISKENLGLFVRS